MEILKEERRNAVRIKPLDEYRKSRVSQARPAQSLHHEERSSKLVSLTSKRERKKMHTVHSIKLQHQPMKYTPSHIFEHPSTIPPSPPCIQPKSETTCPLNPPVPPSSPTKTLTKPHLKTSSTIPMLNSTDSSIPCASLLLRGSFGNGTFPASCLDIYTTPNPRIPKGTAYSGYSLAKEALNSLVRKSWTGSCGPGTSGRRAFGGNSKGRRRTA